MKPAFTSPVGQVAGLMAGLAVLLVGCDTLFPQRSPGEKLYRNLCARCHGLDGRGSTVSYMGNAWADLTDGRWKSGGTPQAIENTIREGIFGQMPGVKGLERQEMKELVGYVIQLESQGP